MEVIGSIGIQVCALFMCIMNHSNLEVQGSALLSCINNCDNNGTTSRHTWVQVGPVVPCNNMSLVHYGMAGIFSVSISYCAGM